MSKYFILQKLYTPDEVELAEIESIRNIEEISLDGKKIDVSTPIRAKLKNNKANFPDLLIGATSLPIVSEKLKEILLDNSFPEKMEFIPIIIDLPVQKSYYVLNILDNLKCFDWKNAEYDDFPEFLKEELPHLSDKPETINKLVLNESKIEKRNLFRMYEQPTSVFISSQLKEEFKKNNVTGCRFAELSEYRKIFYP
jgi:hypothetical protein